MLQTATQRPIDTVLDLFPDAKGPKGADDYYTCRCSSHQDKNPSLLFKAIGDEHSEDGEGVSFTCFAGCSREDILSALNLKEEDLHYRSGTIHTTQAKRTPPVTAFELGVDKRINPNELLATHGVTDGQVTIKGNTRKGVVIPYFTEDGKPYERTRLRTALAAKDGSWWADGDKPLIPYGLNWLESARLAKTLTIVEGESDCWTLWHYGLPALGMPGATVYKGLKLAHLKDIDSIYIIQEPDDAGQKFPSDIKKHLDTIGYRGKVYAVDLSEVGAKDPNDLHKKDLKAFKPTFEKALRQARPLFIPGKERQKPVTHTFQDLMEKQLPPIRWIVPAILAEGLTLLAGKQKLGKSWLLLALGLAVSIGGLFLGLIKVAQCDVLYLALEDNERRLQDRLKLLLAPGERVPAGFHYATRWPRLDAEGLQLLSAWLDEHPSVKLVIIDTWARAKPISKMKNGYDADIDAASGVQALAMERNISVLATCHLRKAGADDALDELNATTGLSATADNILILKRERGNADASLFGTGREIELDKALSFNNGSWTLLGDGDEYRLSQEQKEVIDAIKQAERPIGAKEIAEAIMVTGKQVSDGAIRVRLLIMKKNGLIKDMGNGKYTVIANVTNTANVTNMANVTNAEQNGHTHSVSEDKEALAALVSDENGLTQVNAQQEPCDTGGVSHVSHVSPGYYITPENSTNYPYDVLESLKHRGERAKKVDCLRGHKSYNPLPHHLGYHQWELLCEVCYGKGLRATNGAACFVD